jgi:S-formylglutathione hydrolase FrmB
MLHGWSGHSTKWNEVVNLDSVAKKDGFIIACPDAFYDSWYIDSPVKKNSQIEKFFFEKLIPELFEKYNIDKHNIFITGISMGGHGAIYYFLKHPDFFKSAGSTSGILDITQFPDNWSLPQVLGPYTSNKEIWQNNSDIYLLKNLKEKNKKILVDCGTEDFAFNVNRAFTDSCNAAGIPVEFITSPGTHSLDYWRRSILYHFKFFKEMVGKD